MFHRIGVLAMFLVASQSAALTFEDLSGRIPFVHRSQDIGGNGLGGAVWFDYDRDGQIDLFLGNGPGLPNALYRNDGDGTFTDVTAASGITLPETQTSAALGDVNNDGLLDVFITAPGSIPFQVQYRNRLYLNEGDLRGVF